MDRKRRSGFTLVEILVVVVILGLLATLVIPRVVGRGEEENSSARARFNALVTSSSVSELRRHLRTLVSLLRAREIPLDHAMLADDVAQFQRPGGARAVQLRWARQYYNVTGPVRDEGKSATTTATVREN